MLKGIIFDMDGTLTLTEELHHKAFAQVFSEHGVSFTYEDEIKRFAGCGSENVFKTIFLEKGIEMSAGKIAECVAKKRALYTKIVQESEISVVPGAQAFVKKTQDFGLKRIIATGNSNIPAVQFILKKVGLLKYFPEIISISQVARGKPFPDVFLEAVSRLELQKEECVVLEDAVNGVKAAKAAGIRCIALQTTTARKDLIEAGADSVVKNYLELNNQILYG